MNQLHMKLIPEIEVIMKLIHY